MNPSRARSPSSFEEVCAAQVGALTGSCLPPSGSDSSSSAEFTSGDEPDKNDDPLFDTTRDYVEQLDCYKDDHARPTTTGRRPMANGEDAS